MLLHYSIFIKRQNLKRIDDEYEVNIHNIHRQQEWESSLKWFGMNTDCDWKPPITACRLHAARHWFMNHEVAIAQVHLQRLQYLAKAEMNVTWD